MLNMILMNKAHRKEKAFIKDDGDILNPVLKENTNDNNTIPAGNYMFKVNNRTICANGVILVFLLLTLNILYALF